MEKANVAGREPKMVELKAGETYGVVLVGNLNSGKSSIIRLIEKK